MLNSLLDLRKLRWVSGLDVLQNGKPCLIFPSKDFEFCVQRKFGSTSKNRLVHEVRACSSKYIVLEYIGSGVCAVEWKSWGKKKA
jgi:hypothetical protein